MNRVIRQTLTIARRDFVATVFTPTFLLFLLSPLFTIAFATIGGVSASSMLRASDSNTRMIAFVAPAEQATLRAADTQLRKVFSGGNQPAPLTIEAAGPDSERRARAALDGRGETDASAALYGDLARPAILYGGQGFDDARYLSSLAEMALHLNPATPGVLSKPVLTSVARHRATQSGHKQTAVFAVFGIFFLTLMLAGQAVGTMAEERNNKVIEILAAAAPLESVFFGKLLGMFGSAILFVVFWGVVVSQIGAILPPAYATAIHEIGPAVGLPWFVALFFAYFTMAYLLLGAVFLGVGAQASTPRELQMLSLPITIVQVAIFGFVLSSSGQPDSLTSRIAEIVPFSSPYAMAARSANSPELWPHALALGWQALWVVIAIAAGARAFRWGVLKSGNGPRRRTTRREAVDTGVS